MSASEVTMLCVYILCIIGIIVSVFITTGPWPKRKPKPAEPVPPTFHEVNAADMENWDKRFYAVLEGALPEVCDCDPYPFSCPIHARKPEKTYDLRGIHRHIENNRRRDGHRRARENR